MKETKYWFEIPSLARQPFLAINLTNANSRSFTKNSIMLGTGKAGDWPLPQELLDEGAEGKIAVLFFANRGERTLYIGKILSKVVTGATGNGQARYELTVDSWKKRGITSVSFSRFFTGFRMSANPTVLWAAPSTSVNEGLGDQLPGRAPGSNKMALVAQRVGHGIFAADVRQAWSNKCALTEISAKNILNACHLIPWSHKECIPKYQTDANNGLLLCAHLHALLDSYSISFTDDGHLLIDRNLHPKLSILVSSTGDVCLRKTPNLEQQFFLRWHRAQAEKLKLHLVAA
ncbi:HNH endonuclease [Janthinobacterium sp.]|uniref:HNH endonuclease n=1 Tax=Janthinobacterium sp. TaxID=1871054 RepID=UPI00293D6EEC|nr:HNH endonuclease [Janthinobacterium sp.]